jgi:asparagine synthase (glutamine-hydrolysing)
MAWHRQRVRQSANVPVSGIAGYWGYAAHDIPATVFAGFVDSLAHRGPDGSGINHFPDMRLWLGHRRLSLLEPALEGRQPLADAKRRYWLTFDGTIYNEHTLRHQLRALGHSFASRSSAEMVLAAYAQWGADCLRRFDGIWAVAILDSRDRRLLLARDNSGLKPLHYILGDGAVAFASEPQAFLRLPCTGDAFGPGVGAGTLCHANKQEPKSRTWPHGLRGLRAGHALIIEATGQIRESFSKRSWYVSFQYPAGPTMPLRFCRNRRRQPRDRRRRRRHHHR